MKYALIPALALMACGPTLETANTPDTIHLTGSLGSGDVAASGRQYNKLLKKGKKIIWDGPMVSADAFYAPAAVAMSGGCYTQNATWHPHAASYFGIVPEYIIPGDQITAQLASLLPDAMQETFNASWHRYDPITVAFYSNDDLKAIWPEGACVDPTPTGDDNA